MIFPEIGKTFGMEIETDIISVDRGVDIRPPGWTVTRDASVETDRTLVFGNLYLGNTENIPTDVLNNMQIGGRVTTGAEFLSPIMHIDTAFNQISEILSIIEENGETQKSDRSSIHIHVSMSKNLSLDTLKKIIILAAHFEPLFYYVGGMGYHFRGENNDFIYCRPLTEKGPACIPHNRHYAQCTTVSSLLDSVSVIDFWNRYGDLLNFNRKTNAVRYSFMTLFALCGYADSKETLEFRVFNKSLNPFFVFSASWLCLEFVKLILNIDYDTIISEGFDTPTSIFNFKKSKLSTLVFEFKNIVGRSNWENEIDTIISKVPEIHIDDCYVLTHKRESLNHRWWSNEEFSPKLMSSSGIKKPTYVDIHILRHEHE